MTESDTSGTPAAVKPTAVRDICLKAYLENAIEIEFSADGTFTLPEGDIVAGIIAGKNGGTATVATPRSVSSTTRAVTPCTLSLKCGVASKPNSVIILLR